MRVEQINNTTQYEDFVNKYRQKNCLCNDYLQNRVSSLINSGRFYMACGSHNAFLFERKINCSRLYYYINSIDETFVFKDQSPLVTEILYRGDKFFPKEETIFLEKCGFKKNLVRDQYSAVYKDLNASREQSDILVRKTNTLDEVAWACELFNSSFDPYSGDYIESSQIYGLFENQSILLALDSSGKKCGALHQTVERNNAWVSHVVVEPSARGKHVGQSLLDHFVELNHKDDKSRFMLWVQKQNKAAVAMYQNKGFKYVNKSTLSMIYE